MEKRGKIDKTWILDGCNQTEKFRGVGNLQKMRRVFETTPP